MQKLWPTSGLRTLKRALTIGDKILILGLFLASVASGVVLKSLYREAHYCVISVAGKDVYNLPLYESRIVNVAGPLGESTVEIKDNCVRMSYSPCPFKICMRQGSINNPGEVIICVPNKIMIRITGKKEIDGVTR